MIEMHHGRKAIYWKGSIEKVIAKIKVTALCKSGTELFRKRASEFVCRESEILDLCQ